MERCKDYNNDQLKPIPVAFDRQILPGTSEDSLPRLIDNELDVSAPEIRCENNERGRPAYDPALFPKILIYACRHGIAESRPIEPLHSENVTFMALPADTQQAKPENLNKNASAQL